jgi:hypothetical protein
MVSFNECIDTLRLPGGTQSGLISVGGTHEQLPWGFSLDSLMNQGTGEGGVDTAPSLGGMMSLEGLEEIIWGSDGRSNGGGVLSLLSASPRHHTMPTPREVPHMPAESTMQMGPKQAGTTPAAAGAAYPCAPDSGRSAAFQAVARG